MKYLVYIDKIQITVALEDKICHIIADLQPLLEHLQREKIIGF